MTSDPSSPHKIKRMAHNALGEQMVECVCGEQFIDENPVASFFEHQREVRDGLG